MYKVAKSESVDKRDEADLYVLKMNYMSCVSSVQPGFQEWTSVCTDYNIIIMGWTENEFEASFEVCIDFLDGRVVSDILSVQTEEIPGIKHLINFVQCMIDWKPIFGLVDKKCHFVLAIEITY